MFKKLEKVNMVFLIAMLIIIIVNIIIYFIHKDEKKGAEVYADKFIGFFMKSMSGQDNSDAKNDELKKSDGKISIVIDPGHGGSILRK